MDEAVVIWFEDNPVGDSTAFPVVVASAFVAVVAAVGFVPLVEVGVARGEAIVAVVLRAFEVLLGGGAAVFVLLRECPADFE